jgi:Spy/CpxP family protein refolding chaperone
VDFKRETLRKSLKRDNNETLYYILFLHPLSITLLRKDIDMNAKNLLLPLLAAAVIAAAPVSASAGELPSLPCPQRMIGCDHSAHQPCKPAELTEEQKAEMKAKCEAMRAELAQKRAEFAKKAAERKAQREKLIKEHHAAVMPLHEKLVQKQMELEVLSPNPNVKPEELKALVADICDLRKQMRVLGEEYRAKLEKAGLPCPRFRQECGGPRHGFHGNHGFHGSCER